MVARGRELLENILEAEPLGGEIVNPPKFLQTRTTTVNIFERLATHNVFGNHEHQLLRWAITLMIMLFLLLV